MIAKVSVVICTWNRSNLLDQTLQQMRQLLIPEGVEWEVLIVNNNCTDDTDSVICQHAEALPIRRLFEPVPGKSVAANRAIDHATGDLIVWTDDDVLVDPRWLLEYLKAANAHPDAAFFGGTVDPFFETKPPAWVQRNLDRLGVIYALRQLGEDVRLFGPDELPFGANMAIRREVQKLFRFDVNLGPREKSEIRGEETVLLEQIRANQLSGMFVGTARVRHYIPAARLTTRFLWDWYRGYGRTMVRINGTPAGPTIFGCPRWAIRMAGTSRVFSIAFSPFKGARWLHSFTRAAWMQGMIEESRSQRWVNGAEQRR